MATAGAEKIVEKWNQQFKQATDFDSWGQLVEAAEEYSRLSKMMKSATSPKQGLFDEEKSTNKSLVQEVQHHLLRPWPRLPKVIKKVASCLEVRAKSLQLMKSPADIELAEIKQLSGVMTNLLQSAKVEIPEEISQQINQLRLSSGTSSPSPDPPQEAGEELVSQLTTSTFNSLLPRLQAEKGETLITVKIEKIGLKNASSHIDPYFIVTCKDVAGVDLCKSQKTPTATRRDDAFLYFGIDVEIQTCIQRLPRSAAIFFELKHYKPQKRATSSKCFAFMEQDELKPGPCVIELYRKPIDYKRKKLALLTSKPLYLHLNLSLHAG